MLVPILAFTTNELNRKNFQQQHEPYINIGGRQFVLPNDIIFFEGDVNYSRAHFINGKKMTVATTLKICEERFRPFNFFRVHKGFLVNMGYIKKFCEIENCLQMTEDQLITISRRKVIVVKNKISIK